jgi:hypothetical protein
MGNVTDDQGVPLSGATILEQGTANGVTTDFAGVEPEVNLTGSSKGRGLDYFTNPGTRSFLFKLNF